MTVRPVEITVLFNNVPQDPGIQTAHGFSCLIEGLSKTVLFDTGGDGHILLENMAKLGQGSGGRRHHRHVAQALGSLGRACSPS